MGDRTSVTLSVLAVHSERALKIMEHETPEMSDEHDNLMVYSYDEVNYGNLSFLEKLVQAGIPYDSEWGDGSEYSTGTASCRFTEDGEIIQKEIYDNQLNPDMDSLLKLIDTPHALCQFILDHKEKTSTLPWDNQEEYSKIFRAKKLIT